MCLQTKAQLSSPKVWKNDSRSEMWRKKDKCKRSFLLPGLPQNSQISTSILLILKENKLHKWDRCFLFVMTVAILLPFLPLLFCEASGCAMTRGHHKVLILILSTGVESCSNYYSSCISELHYKRNRNQTFTHYCQISISLITKEVIIRTK